MKSEEIERIDLFFKEGMKKDIFINAGSNYLKDYTND